MAQTPRIIPYRAHPNEKFPFSKKKTSQSKKKTRGEKLKGPSGSKWTDSQLRWLGIDHQIECTLEDIVPSMTLSQKVRKYFDDNLNLALEDVLARKTLNHDFYVDLRQLLTPEPELALYEKSSNYEGSSQPPELHSSPLSQNRQNFMRSSPLARDTSGPAPLLNAITSSPLRPSGSNFVIGPRTGAPNSGLKPSKYQNITIGSPPATQTSGLAQSLNAGTSSPSRPSGSNFGIGPPTGAPNSGLKPSFYNNLTFGGSYISDTHAEMLQTSDIFSQPPSPDSVQLEHSLPLPKIMTRAEKKAAQKMEKKAQNTAKKMAKKAQDLKDETAVENTTRSFLKLISSALEVSHLESETW